MNENLSPDSTVLQQIEGHWQKLFAILLWKTSKRERRTITVEEIAALGAAFPDGGPVVYTHGHADSIEFQLVTRESALRLAAHDKTMRGTA
jgi:hypothetical protein